MEERIRKREKKREYHLRYMAKKQRLAEEAAIEKVTSKPTPPKSAKIKVAI